MKERIKQWLQKIFQRKHNDAVIKDRVRPEISDDPDYRFGDFRDEIKDVERIRSFLNTFTNHLNRYELTPIQLKVLSHIGFQSELSGSQPNLTMTKIAKDLGLKFTTAQRCIEKLGDGYTYKFSSGKEMTKAGSELVKHEKPEKGGGREGSISISTKGKRFLEDIGSVIADYSVPSTEKVNTVRQMNNVSFVGQVKFTVQDMKPRTLNDLQATEKQSPEDVSKNQWFFPFVDKLCSLGSGTMSVQQLNVLCFIAKQGTNGALTKDICGAMNTTLSSIQRQLGRLGKGYKFKHKLKIKEREGLDLLENFQDPNNRKQYLWVLNKKGAIFFKQLNSFVHHD